jgi:membrane protein DedA with SNARE-associated domain
MGELIHQFIDTVLQWLTGLGYWGIMIGLMLEVIPSEIVLAYGGFLVARGDIDFWWAVVFGTIGGTIAQIFVYWIGLYGGRPFLEKYGKYILINSHHIDVAESWFNRYGTGVIFTARFIPVVRHAISVPAGIARMPLWKFTVLTTLAVIPWSIFFIWLGVKLGDNWKNIDEAAAPYIKPIMWTAIILTAGYVIYKLIQGRRRRGQGGSASKGVLAAGLEGEHHTAHQLKYIGREYRVFHRRRVRIGSHSQEFDHIVVGPNGLFHIDSKHWSGDIEFSEKGVTRSGEGKNEDPTGQMYRHEYVLKELLRHHQVKAELVGVICFTHPSSNIIGKSPAFETLKADRLLHFIKTYRTRKALTDEEVKYIARLIETHSQSS